MFSNTTQKKNNTNQIIIDIYESIIFKNQAIQFHFKEYKILNLHSYHTLTFSNTETSNYGFLTYWRKTTWMELTLLFCLLIIISIVLSIYYLS